MADGKIEIRQIIGAVCLIMLGGLLGGFAGILLLRFTPPVTRVEMVIGPVGRDGAVTMGAGAGIMRIDRQAPEQWHSMAETRSDEIVSDYTRFRQMMIGPVMATTLLQTVPELVAQMMPAPRFQWLYHLAGRTIPEQPGPLEVARMLVDRVDIRPIAETALHRLVIRSTTPDTASQLLNRLYQLTDHMMRAEASRRLQIQIDYVTDQLQHVTQTNQREALGDMLARFSQARIMLAVDLPYAADLVSPPVIARDRDPPLLVVVSVSALLGALGAGLLILWRWSGKHHE